MTTMTLTGEERPPFRLRVRGRTQSPADAVEFSDPNPVKALEAALNYKTHSWSEPVIEWEGRERLCVLDVDAHNGPLAIDLHNFGCTFKTPPPVYSWVSHGKGLKVIYAEAPHSSLTAEDQASIARYFLRYRTFTRASAFELHSYTRHPAYRRGEQSCDYLAFGRFPDPTNLAAVRKLLLGDLSQDAFEDEALRDEWLDEQGLYLGQRLPHSRCFIQPTDTCTSDPILVGERGIICFRCQAKGIAYRGMSTPGFVPYAVLAGETIPTVRNDLRAAVRHKCHWAHARHIIPDEGAYRALLKLWHLRPDLDDRDRPAVEQLIDRVFDPKLGIVRAHDGSWLEADSLAPHAPRGLDELLRCLPTAYYVEHGAAKLSLATLGLLRGASDLTKFGYPGVTVLRGVDMVTFARPMEDVEFAPVRAVSEAKPPFRYRPPEERERLQAEKCIIEHFPGINVPLLRLLVAMKGLHQLGFASDAPQILITGQSGSGKSTTAKLAAVIACDVATECRFNPDPQRVLQAYAVASQLGTYAVFNEAGKSHVSGRQLRDYCLMFARGIIHHRLYHGPARIDQPAIVVLTEPNVPDDLRLDEQTARRIAVADLGAGAHAGGKDWASTCGTNDVERWRLPTLFGYHDVCDAFLSDVIDRFFRPGCWWTFRDLVHACGFKMLNELDDGQHAELRRFYELVQALPEYDGGSSRWRGPGWRVFHRDAGSEVAALFAELTANGQDVGLLVAAPWGRITGQPGAVCKVSVHRAQVGVKFVPGPGSESPERSLRPRATTPATALNSLSDKDLGLNGRKDPPQNFCGVGDWEKGGC